MRRLAIFLLLLALAAAQCDSIVSDLETSYANYLHTSIDCTTLHSTTLYAKLSQLAEGYSYAAQCFSDEGNRGKALAYYSLAAGRYSAAADALCSTDYALKMGLYISSGDAYHSAGQDALAKESYEKAVAVYSSHPGLIDNSLYSLANSKIYEMEHPMAKTLSDVGDSSSISWLPFAIAGLVFVGIGLAIVALKR